MLRSRPTTISSTAAEVDDFLLHCRQRQNLRARARLSQQPVTDNGVVRVGQVASSRSGHFLSVRIVELRRDLNSHTKYEDTVGCTVSPEKPASDGDGNDDESRLASALPIVATTLQSSPSTPHSAAEHVTPFAPEDHERDCARVEVVGGGFDHSMSSPHQQSPLRGQGTHRADASVGIIRHRVQVYDDSLPRTWQPQHARHLPEARHQSWVDGNPVIRLGGRRTPVPISGQAQQRGSGTTRGMSREREIHPRGLAPAGFRGLYGGAENAEEELQHDGRRSE